MVYRSYLRQNVEVSREFRDVSRKKKKIVNLNISLTGLSRREQEISLQSAKIHTGRRDARTCCSMKRVNQECHVREIAMIELHTGNRSMHTLY